MASTKSQVKAAIYVRISKDSEDAGLGVARQEKDCRTKAKEMGWKVVGVYSDNDTSASSGALRKQYGRMRRAVESGEVTAIVVWAVDRLTRSPRELEEVIDWADRFDVKLASVGGAIDLHDPAGRMHARMMGTVARYEVEQAGRRIRAKHKELAEAGVHSGARPFGWRIDREAPGGLVVDEAEAEIVRECTERALAGEGLWKICKDLNDRGILTTRGNPWVTQVLRRMLLRWANVAYREHQQVKMLDGKQVRFGKVERYEAKWEPIVDRKAYDQLRAKLTDPARRSNNRGTEPKYLLTSYARCGKCGKYVVGAVEARATIKNTGRVRTYPDRYICPHARCHGVMRRMEPVDRMVNEFVINLLERDGVRLLGGDERAAKDAQQQIDTLQAKLDSVADQFAADEVTGEQLARITASLRPRLAEQKQRLLQAMPPPGDLQGLTGTDVRAAWENADVTRRKTVLRIIGIEVTILPVGPGNGGRFDPSSVRIEMGK